MFIQVRFYLDQASNLLSILAAMEHPAKNLRPPNTLKYASPKMLDKVFVEKEYGIFPGKINFLAQNKCTPSALANHEIKSYFGQKKIFEEQTTLSQKKERINQAISGGGDVFVITTSAHAPLIHLIDDWNPQKIKFQIMDQQFISNPKIKRTRKYEKDPSIITIFRAIPGGDPTEEWGELYSNTLIKIK